MIVAKHTRACLPVRFIGWDPDLVAVEAAFDVLNNTAAPSADGIDLSKERDLGQGGVAGLRGYYCHIQPADSSGSSIRWGPVPCAVYVYLSRVFRF